MMLLGISVT